MSRMDASEPAEPLAGKVIAVPEARQLDVLASMLEKRAARVLRYPLVAIRDAEPEAPVVEWLRRFVAAPPDLLILYTGEGVTRLLGFAERAELRDAFAAALAQTRKLTRGPKPKRALRALGLGPDLEPAEPTTDGILAALDSFALEGWRVGVQLYGMEPNDRLRDYVVRRGAVYDAVAPYTYASEADDEQVADLIARLARGEIDAIAFTSTAQLERLRKFAREHGLESSLRRGLETTRIAAVGPVVAAALEAEGLRADAMPAESFHMKPLVNAVEALFRG
jgi:uroporphyrinogen-III synthase